MVFVFRNTVVFFARGQTGDVVDKLQLHFRAGEVVAVVVDDVIELFVRFGGVFEFEENQQVAVAVLPDLEFVDFVVGFLVFGVVVVEVRIEHHGEYGGRNGDSLFVVHQSSGTPHHFAYES